MDLGETKPAGMGGCGEDLDGFAGVAENEKASWESQSKGADQRGSGLEGTVSIAAGEDEGFGREAVTFPTRANELSLLKGQTSIKVVCDAVWKSNPEIRADFPEYLKIRDGEILSPYASLPPVVIDGHPVVVADGTGAIRAYDAMMSGAEHRNPETKRPWRDLLLQYCRLDTLAMLWIGRHWNSRAALHPVEAATRC